MNEPVLQATGLAKRFTEGGLDVPVLNNVSLQVLAGSTLAGVAFGLLVALSIGTLVPALERLLGVAFLPGSIYVISRMPSDPRLSDVLPITLISLVLAFLATLYPSWRASRVNPAEALRYE